MCSSAEILLEGSLHSLLPGVPAIIRSTLSMKVRFYFDYCDYRSYLMMHSLQSLDVLPIHVQWIAMDAYSLRSLSGYARQADCHAERRYLFQEARRFATQEGIPFFWRQESIHSGLALRVGLWLMQHAPNAFESFSRLILTQLWAHGQEMSTALLRDALEALDLDYEAILDEASGPKGFLYQDTCLQEAISDGIFDVASLVMGDSLLTRFDQQDIIRRTALHEWLKTLPPSLVLQSCASLVDNLAADQRKHHIQQLIQASGQKTAYAAPIERTIQPIAHSLLPPEGTWRLPQALPRTDITVCLRSGHGPDPLLDAFQRSADAALNLCPEAGHPYRGVPAFAQSAKKRLTARLFAAYVLDDDTPACLILRVDAKGNVQEVCLLRDSDDIQHIVFSWRGWTIAAFSPQACLDLNMARLAAHQGANLVLHLSPPQQASVPTAEAWGCVARAWIIDIKSTAPFSPGLVDAESRRQALEEDADTKLSPPCQLKHAPQWQALAPRTLLLYEKSLSFGEISANADIELACRGQNLEVTTLTQKSEISFSRVLERVRIGESLIQMLPFCGEQIFATEFVSHKILKSLSRSPREAIPILINYWHDLEFELLVIMRPVLATLIMTWRIPIVVVVLNQIVEVWLCSPQGTAYRIEKDDELYRIDLGELSRAEHCFPQMLRMLNLDETAYLRRLESLTQTPDT